MIEMHHLKNLVISSQAILSFVLSRKITTGNVLDCLYHQNCYKLIGIDLSI